jgi:hypothetical protein
MAGQADGIKNRKHSSARVDDSENRRRGMRQGRGIFGLGSAFNFFGRYAKQAISAREQKQIAKLRLAVLSWLNLLSRDAHSDNLAASNHVNKLAVNKFALVECRKFW